MCGIGALLCSCANPLSTDCLISGETKEAMLSSLSAVLSLRGPDSVEIAEIEVSERFVALCYEYC